MCIWGSRTDNSVEKFFLFLLIRENLSFFLVFGKFIHFEFNWMKKIRQLTWKYCCSYFVTRKICYYYFFLNITFRVYRSEYRSDGFSAVNVRLICFFPYPPIVNFSSRIDENAYTRILYYHRTNRRYLISFWSFSKIV